MAMFNLFIVLRPKVMVFTKATVHEILNCIHQLGASQWQKRIFMCFVLNHNVIGSKVADVILVTTITAPPPCCSSVDVALSGAPRCV